MQTVNEAHLQVLYGGKFVALQDDKVIESADTNKDLVEKLKARKIKSEEVTLAYIHPKDRLCAF